MPLGDPSVESNCTNGIDDDSDGQIDCLDPDCAGDPACAAPGTEVCTGGVDEDGDSLIDCADPDCFGDPACLPGSENCSDGVDNDGDGYVDCADPDCIGYSNGSGWICAYGARQETNCLDGIDNDGDGDGDCLDPMCADVPACGGGIEVCGGAADVDGDGHPGCIDAGCQLQSICYSWDVVVPGPVMAVCNTGSSDPNCTSGRKAAGSGTCKPIDPVCYIP